MISQYLACGAAACSEQQSRISSRSVQFPPYNPCLVSAVTRSRHSCDDPIIMQPLPDTANYPYQAASKPLTDAYWCKSSFKKDQNAKYGLPSVPDIRFATKLLESRIVNTRSNSRLPVRPLSQSMPWYNRHVKLSGLPRGSLSSFVKLRSRLSKYGMEISPWLGSTLPLSTYPTSTSPHFTGSLQQVLLLYLHSISDHEPPIGGSGTARRCQPGTLYTPRCMSATLYEYQMNGGDVS